MRMKEAESAVAEALPSGPGAAAIVSAAVGCFVLAIIAVVADKAPTIARLLTFYRPTGPLSGVTTMAILIWLGLWTLLHFMWGGREIALGRVNAVAFVLVFAALLLTFPPIGDLF